MPNTSNGNILHCAHFPLQSIKVGVCVFFLSGRYKVQQIFEAVVCSQIATKRQIMLPFFQSVRRFTENGHLRASHI